MQLALREKFVDWSSVPSSVTVCVPPTLTLVEKGAESVSPPWNEFWITWKGTPLLE